MLICPQCEFENPEANKFCQNCGVSLTEKSCCHCQANIPIEAKTCSFCGAVNHTVLWAIVSQKKSVAELVLQPELTEVTSSNTAIKGHKLKIEDLSDLFISGREKIRHSLPLKAQDNNTSHRYAFEGDTTSNQSLQPAYQSLDSTFLQGKVIDKYPLQKPRLVTLQQQQMEIFADLKQGQGLNNSYLSVAEYWNQIGLPTHALPYLILEKYTPTVPKIYDAWQQQDQGVVLLPDRSRWQLLTDLWSQQKMPLLQIIWFLDEMAKLWKPLQQINCAQSLLVNNNLRIDEDQAFCLQQLYIDQEDNIPTLKDLAQTWQFCFAQSNIDNLDNLNQLLDRVISGEIIEIEELRLELHNLGLSEDEFESFDIHTNYYPTVNIPQSDPDKTPIQPNFQADFQIGETSEPQSFFSENDEDMMYSSEFDEQATAMIPMQLKSVADASCTDIGLQRDHNEDFFGIKTIVEKVENNAENHLSVRGLYIVCDGMGGHAAGEVASAMAVEQLQKFFQTHWQEELPDHDTIEAAILLANETLYQTNIDNSRSGSGRMGTTLVMALLQDTQLAIAHVGDSRIYRLTRKQGLERLTLDHEVGQREINRGVEPDIAYGRPDAYQLTQALGPRESNYVRPDIQFLEVTEDCLLLLCSDGLSDNDLLENHWEEYLEPLISSGSDLQAGLFKLINLANEYNGHDNITAILVKIKLKADF
ncbi:MAG: serine/threonine phosphatase [Waterburya sp.]